MMHFIAVMLVCGILSIFFGPLPFVVAGIGYLAKWMFWRR